MLKYKLDMKYKFECCLQWIFNKHCLTSYYAFPLNIDLIIWSRNIFTNYYKSNKLYTYSLLVNNGIFSWGHILRYGSAKLYISFFTQVFKEFTEKFWKQFNEHTSNSLHLSIHFCRALASFSLVGESGFTIFKSLSLNETIRNKCLYLQDQGLDNKYT